MRKIIITTLLAATGLLAAACGSSATSTASHSHGNAGMSGTTPAPAAPAAAQPFKITPVYCGKYSPAQMNQFEDYGGLIFKYTNSSTQPDSVVVRVNFVQGSQVLGSNVTAYEPTIRPGQTADAEVGYPANSMPAHFSCQVTSVGDHY